MEPGSTFTAPAEVVRDGAAPPLGDTELLISRLLDKSLDAYVMALETINRLSAKYRIESFCILLL